MRCRSRFPRAYISPTSLIIAADLFLPVFIENTDSFKVVGAEFFQSNRAL